jgi:enoyl-CoA hydratase/carnithine racemase
VSDTDVLTVDISDYVATVSFNRPEVLNAVNMATLESLITVFERLNDEPDVRCVILRGAGRAFCVGADQKERPGMSDNDIRRRRRLAPAAFGAMRGCAHPVVAQVHGFALGGGLEMALGCDLILAAEDTVMGLIETTRASIPAGGGTQLLPRLIGPLRAKELVLTGRKFTAADAAGWGLVNYAVPAADLEAAVADLVGQICAAAPISCRQAKRAMDAAMDVDLRTGIHFEEALYERVLGTEDRAEALTAYREKRPARFVGR